MSAYEVNFDGLVGPTHNYSGLSFGNIASESSLKDISNPKLAAKQGLQKMKDLADRGFKQGVLLPQQRPDIGLLRQLGFEGTDAQVLTKAAKKAPAILGSVYSASSMWTANAATVSPSADSADGRVHFTAANLNAKLHRAIEHPTTSRILQALFHDERYFAHHGALPSVGQFGDEGAANHTRFCSEYDAKGVQFFVYGRSAFSEHGVKPKRYPARQTLEASQAVARLHGNASENLVFAQQRPETIDAGVFHNDVIAVGNRNVLFCHEYAFVDQEEVLAELDHKLLDADLHVITVKDHEVPLRDAVSSYLFNSQLLSLPDGSMLLVVPSECRQVPSVDRYLDKLVSGNNPISEIAVFDLKQSMKNGGGPACLRLRVALTEQELQAVHPHALLTDELFHSLNAWIDKHYRDQIAQTDLADIRLFQESLTALDEITQLLKLPSIYPFQLV
jgi:succinylarginine dihydrolase